MKRTEEKYLSKKEFMMIKKTNYVLTEKFIRKNYLFPTHWHSNYEMEIIFSGKGIHTLNGKQQELSRGSAVLITPFDNHSIGATDDMYVVSIYFNKDMLPQKLADTLMNKSGFMFCLTDEELDIIEFFLPKLREIDENTPLYHVIASNIITTVVLFSLDKVPDTSLTTPSLIQKSLILVNSKFKENISIKSIAGELFVSAKYLGALFEKTTGISFHTYLNRVRLKYACTCLDNTDKSIKEIAFESGYRSTEHFIYTFKKILLCTPTQFRKSPKDKHYVSTFLSMPF